MVARVVSWLRRSTLVFDWHNFGYTILGLHLSPSPIFLLNTHTHLAYHIMQLITLT
jgi:hypothetical protein